MTRPGVVPTTHGAPARRGPERRYPLHIAVAVGASTGIYALALVAVTRLQIASDSALIAARDPAVRAIHLLDEHHDRMAAELEAARAAYAAGADRFNALAAGLPGVEEGLDRLDATLAAIEAELRAMPGSFNIPKAPPRITASGSGSTSGGTVPAPPPKPAATPPPTQGTTGASG